MGWERGGDRVGGGLGYGVGVICLMQAYIIYVHI